MSTTQQVGISLPDAETIRVRIDRLNAEVALLRKLLRLVMRIESNSATTAESSRATTLQEMADAR